MFAKQKNQNSIIVSALRVSWVLLLLLWALAGSGQAQTDAKKAHLPILQEYKGVKIGMMAADVRAKLGKAQSDDKDGLFYVFSDDESAQILIDAQQKVRCVSVMYSGENLKPLSFEEVFGKNVEPEKKPDGALYKLVKYTEAGYWVSYNRMPGDKATVIVVMQKMP